jgi:hypothetical protein
MQGLLKYIDFDNYRSTQLMIARAEIAELRRQASAPARTEQPLTIPTIARRPVGDFEQTLFVDSEPP